MGATLSLHLQTLVRIAQAAGTVVMHHYEAGCNARVKADRSPVTDADEEAEKLILAELARAFPDVPVVAEEAAAAGKVVEAGRHFFLVDPVDGTKEFVKRGGEFTVNIGEIVDGKPVAGVVLAPAIGRLFVGRGGGRGHLRYSGRPAAPRQAAKACGRRTGGGIQPLASRCPYGCAAQNP